MILIVEDSKDVNHMLKEALEQAGYVAESAYDGVSASKLLRQKEYQLVLLDLMLPYRSGDQVLKELRTFSQIPVIVISAKDMVGTKIDLLKLGADDYVTKPFDLDEVVARVESNLRRYASSAQTEEILTFSNLTLEVEGKRALIDGVEVELTAKELSILELLLRNQKKVFTKANLYETIWQETYYGDDNTIKAHMSNLRSKLKEACPEKEYIDTVWGLGYRLHSDS